MSRIMYQYQYTRHQLTLGERGTLRMERTNRKLIAVVGATGQQATGTHTRHRTYATI
jgi:hypothetical protein